MKLTFVIFALQLAVGAMLGRLAIPVFRKMKTGKFEIYIGDRFRQDGSEPRGGGAVMLISFAAACFAGAAAGAFDAAMLRGMVGVMMYTSLLTAVGLAEDYDKDVRGGLGMKSRYRIITKLVLSGGFLALMQLFGYECGKVLLPFRWGYTDLGMAGIPINAIFMTVLITAAEITDCQHGIHDTGIDGLSAKVMFVGFLGLFAAFGNGGHEEARLTALCAAGSCAGYLIWGMRPSKLYTGRTVSRRGFMRHTGIIGTARGCAVLRGCAAFRACCAPDAAGGIQRKKEAAAERSDDTRTPEEHRVDGEPHNGGVCADTDYFLCRGGGLQHI